jgi:uncharacterized protein YndB with AHSA1/START domain
MSATTAAIEDTVTLTRQFKAPRESVFAAFASANTLSQWLGPKDGKVLSCEVDFKVGGKYRYAFHSPEMGDMAVNGEYREIAPPARIVFTWQWEDDEDWTGVVSVITIDLTAKGADTELHLTQTGFPNTQSRDNHGRGWGMCFDRLEVLVAS